MNLLKVNIMKKTLLVILSAVFVLISCEKNAEKGEEITTYPLYYSATEFDGDLKSGGTGMSVATIAYTELDEVIIDITTDPSISVVDIYTDATTIGASVSLANGEGTLNASLAAMGIPDVGDADYIGLHYEFSGKNANETAYLRQISPWTELSLPSMVEKDMTGRIEWLVETANATIDDVTITVQKNSDPEEDYTAQALDGSLDLSGLDYARDDVISVTATATAGTKTATATGTITVKKWAFDLVASEIELIDGADLFDLETLEFTDTGGHLALSSGIGNVGFTGTDVEFVPTDKAFYDDNDVNLVMAAYATSVPVTTVNNANIDDAYIFKTSTDVYGLMIVTRKDEYSDPSKSTLTVEVMILD